MILIRMKNITIYCPLYQERKKLNYQTQKVVYSINRLLLKIDMISWMVMNGMDVMPMESMQPREPPPEIVTESADVSIKRKLNTPDDEEERKKQRLQRNREIARKCREKKKEKQLELEAELQCLRQKNTELKGMLERNNVRENREDGQRQKLAKLEELLSSNSPKTEEIQSIMKSYYESWSEFGEVRNQQIIWHLNQLKRVLLPAQLTKMTIWSLQQDDEFYDVTLNNATHGGSIWDILVNTINLTKEQQTKIIGFRNAVKQQRRNLAEALTTMDTIAKNVKDILESMTSQMVKIMEILSPIQQAKFLTWMNQNATSIMSNVKNSSKRNESLHI